MREVGILISKLGKRVGPCHKCINVVICAITIDYFILLKYVIWGSGKYNGHTCHIMCRGSWF
jgi:hypothetical protein